MDLFAVGNGTFELNSEPIWDSAPPTRGVTSSGNVFLATPYRAATIGDNTNPGLLMNSGACQAAGCFDLQNVDFGTRSVGRSPQASTAARFMFSVCFLLTSAPLFLYSFSSKWNILHDQHHELACA